MIRRIIRRLRHRPKTAFDIQRALSKCELIYDVGANTGQAATKYKAAFPDAKIFCFEPNPAAVEALRGRFADDPLVQIVETAIGKAEGSAEMLCYSESSINSLLPYLPNGRRYTYADTMPVGRITVPVITLDAFAADKGHKHIDVLKIDVEGAEMAVLEGASTLLDGGVEMVFAEVRFFQSHESGATFQSIDGFLSRFGFRLLNLFDMKSAKSSQLRYANGLFISEDLQRRVELMDVKT